MSDKHGTPLTDGQLATFLGEGQKALVLAVRKLHELDPGLVTDYWPRNSKIMQKMFLEVLSQPQCIVTVNRKVCPCYPEWVKEIIHPTLQGSGPAEYNLADVKLWLHNHQKNKNNGAQGNNIYQYLKDASILSTCLSLRDGEEIKKMGGFVFRKYFGNNNMFLWKSVMRHHDGDIYVPHLCAPGSKVIMEWRYLDSGWWRNSDPAAYFS